VVDRDCESIVGIHIEQACLSLFVMSSIQSLAEGFEEDRFGHSRINR